MKNTSHGTHFAMPTTSSAARRASSASSAPASSSAAGPAWTVPPNLITSKKPFLADIEQDRISCLPAHVIDQILSDLSIREAVRTSVLSSSWRYKWTTLPNLDFVGRFSAASHHPIVTSRIIDHVLLLHFGPIKKFNISCPRRIHAEDIDRWILHLIGRSIEELALRIIKGPCYKIPQRLFSCQSLQCLELHNCWLKLPPTIEGLRNLKCLDLNCVTIVQDAFEKLISSCPLLEEISLWNLDGMTKFNIHAPNLKNFELSGIFDDINFDNTFQLTEVSVDLNSNSDNNESTLYGCSSNLLKFFAHLSSIKKLYIETHFLKYLVAGVVPVKLPLSCINLSFLCLEIDLNDMKEISAALCVFRSSPNLQELEIYVRSSKQTVTSYCTENIFYAWPAMQLRHVSIYDISGFKSEFDLIRFVLLYSPVLQRMTLRPVLNVGLDLAKELSEFKRASGEAKIICIDPA